MKKIQCTIDTLNIAIEEVAKYEEELNRKVKTFLKKIASLGIEEAQTRFTFAQYDGDNDVKVEKSPQWLENNKLAIVASGSAILFIEFGTGVFYAGQAHPLAGEFGYERGGFGYGLGRLQSWRYVGVAGTNGEIIQEGKHKGEVLTHGNPANRAMYDTAKDLREKISDIARGVFI